MEETGAALWQLLKDEKLTRVPLLIMSNKQDLLNAMAPTEVCGAIDNTFNLKYVYCSTM